MGSWKRFFTTVPDSIGKAQPYNESASSTPSNNNFSSHLQEVYTGSPNRIERYSQYEQMDSDSVVNSSLNTIAEFCTQNNQFSKLPFTLEFKSDDTTSIEKTTIDSALKSWCYLNDFKSRLYYIVRNTLIYGDCFFIRDPETFEWEYVNPKNVDKVIIDENNGKTPETYVVRDIDLNLSTKVATTQPVTNNNSFAMSQSQATQSTSVVGSGASYTSSTSNSRYNQPNNAFSVPGKHIIHISLNTGLDPFWPFGKSILESVYKVHKHKELLEDAMVIYRVQRAPDRRVFYIDTGTLPSHKAMQFVERVKNEIQQRRIPSRTGGGTSIGDASYNPLCIALDTIIPLLDGRKLTLSQLISEYKDGKENWIYSCDPVTGAVLPGNITWAGITRKNTQVIKLTLDNGKTITCTPDHKFPILGKGKVEAKDIKVNEDSLISFETQYKGFSNLSHDRTYEQVYDHSDQKWKFTHRIVGNFFKKMNKHQQFTFLSEHDGKDKLTIHHKDYNRYNNDPRNLQFMNKEDHIAWHVHNKKDYWKNISNEERNRITSKISNTLKEHYNTLSEDDRKKLSEYAKQRSTDVHREMKKNNPEKHKQWYINSGKARRKYILEHPQFKQFLIKNNLDLYRIPSRNQEIKFDRDLLNRAMTLIKKNDWNRLETINGLSSDSVFMNRFKEINKQEQSTDKLRIFYKLSTQKITGKCLNKMIKVLGYKNWHDLKDKSHVYNHKVVKIEWLDEKIDTGTLTIDGNERWHNHHTFAVDAGVFICNSILEDYYFPVNADGKGSRVEILNGGAELGTINDLLYFNNQLIRGLGVPSSYIPTGPDESAVTYSDGKIGQAFIQEWKFSIYCKRIQQLLIKHFDYEFKLYLKTKGIIVESSQFELSFEEPESFSEYRLIEKDTARFNNLNQALSIPFMSKRFAMKRYGGLSDVEIAENEQLWKEENKSKVKGIHTIEQQSPVSLRNIGITPEYDTSNEIEPVVPDMPQQSVEQQPSLVNNQAPPPQSSPSLSNDGMGSDLNQNFDMNSPNLNIPQ